ncbi:hypothetical protein AAIA22_004499, partial [Salmonella enterica subsp. enterica serovar Braenderup]
IVFPAEEELNVRASFNDMQGQQGEPEPDQNTLRRIAGGEGNSDSDFARIRRTDKEHDAGRVAEVSGVSRQVTELARNERDIARQTDTQERGRMPEHEEQTLSRTIQKER